jgi:hypothetical protein
MITNLKQIANIKYYAPLWRIVSANGNGKTRKEIKDLLIFGSSHLMPIDGLPVGVTIFQIFLSICKNHLLIQLVQKLH